MKATKLPARRLIICCLFFAPFLLFSQKQTATIRGTIVAVDGEPAGGVTVEIRKLGRISVSDSKGHFIFQYMPALTDSLFISSVETYLLKQPVQLRDGEQLDLGIIHLNK